MNKFNINPEPHDKDLYYISLNIVIYREKLGQYPSFLKDFENSSEYGYSTKFKYFLDEKYALLTKEKAMEEMSKLEEKYKDILNHCEETGDWSTFPLDFDKMTLLESR